MNLSFFAFSLLITVCLAADSHSPEVPQCNLPIREIDSLRNIIMKKHPEVLPPVLVSCNNWDMDEARAFAIGLALGKQSYGPKAMNTSAKALVKECILLGCINFWSPSDTEKRVIVNMKELLLVISANFEWKESNETYNPFAEFFSIQEIQKPENYKKVMFPEEVRSLFVKYSKSTTAMIAIDVAILKWLSHAIQLLSDCEKSKRSILHLHSSLIAPLCALSLYPQIGELCSKDILIFLSEVERNFKPIIFHQFQDHYYFPTLLTLIKTLGEGLIRLKVKEIADKSQPKKDFFITGRLFLELDHPVVQSLEAKLSAARYTRFNALWSHQIACDRKVHSMNNNSMISCDPISTLLYFHYPTYTSALLKEDNTLEWDGTSNFEFVEQINFSNEPGPQPKQLRLFILSQLKPPAAMWKEFTSCTSMTEFVKCLEKPMIRTWILTYEISILESSSIYKVIPIQRIAENN